MNKKNNFGIIFDIDSTKILFGGLAYLKSEKVFKNGKFEDSSNIIDFFSGKKNHENKINMNLAFAKKIDELKNKRKENEIKKTDRLRNINIQEYFKEKRNSILDIILLVQNPIQFNDVDVATKYSILYFELEDGKNVGFFIDKNFAKILFEDKVD